MKVKFPRKIHNTENSFQQSWQSLHYDIDVFPINYLMNTFPLLYISLWAKTSHIYITHYSRSYSGNNEVRTERQWTIFLSDSKQNVMLSKNLDVLEIHKLRFKESWLNVQNVKFLNGHPVWVCQCTCNTHLSSTTETVLILTGPYQQ